MSENPRSRVPFIWVCSYPKSGNTWMRTLLREYITRLKGQPPFECNDVSHYWYQTVSPRPTDTMDALEYLQLRPAAMMHLTTVQRYRQKPKPAAVVKSHMLAGAFEGIPFFSPLWVDHAVYIYRDPRDVLPSLADHMGKTLVEAADMMSDDTATIGSPERYKLAQPLGTWSEHALTWINQNSVHTTSTSYENMHKDTGRELRKVLRHCGIEVDQDLVAEAVEASTFDKLRAQEEEEGFVETSENQERFFRRGEVGSHKDEVPRPLRRRIERDHGDMMKMLGYGDD